ncbi:hypothetical protein KW850_20970 [Bacillus sp. sid0103]|uniref:hypothetical protein n=1 Tax=Bacillus sp. sid0103 TaxID=2856337 RepID=UPI001C495DA6|nr:hypothetical protein [Bacillus sp. sid0103]MBV7507705.1 hypothetical protein [Bacillus sp. sid0103]
MKKVLTVLGGIIIALSLFVTTGNTAKAAAKPGLPTTDHDCGCDVTTAIGSEKNKFVADLLSSQEFKNAKQLITNAGFNWRGKDNIVVEVNHTLGDAVLIVVPFYTQAGSIEIAFFINGHYVDHLPVEVFYNE